MRRTIAVLTCLLAASCSSAEPPREEAAPAEEPTSRFEAGAHTARTAEQEINDAQAQSQARMDEQMRAATDSGSNPLDQP